MTERRRAVRFILDLTVYRTRRWELIVWTATLPLAWLAVYYSLWWLPLVAANTALVVWLWRTRPWNHQRLG